MLSELLYMTDSLSHFCEFVHLILTATYKFGFAGPRL
jgi:hypothetical protein